MNTVDKSGQRTYDGTGFQPDPLLWVQLEREKPDAICRRALVGYDREKGFLLPFLSQTFGILPGKRGIVALERGVPQHVSFELELIILTYLLRARPISLAGKKVNEKQIPGGETFFRGPHSLQTGPMEGLFGHDRKAFLRAGRKLKGRVIRSGDAGICLPVFPRVPMILILWEADAEFPARITVNFDSTISWHLPLDIIWATVHVVAKCMVCSA
jgi:hypothetical protein